MNHLKLAIDASQIATSQYETKLLAVLQKDQSLAGGDVTLWPDIAYATRRLARDTTPDHANETLDAVFSTYRDDSDVSRLRRGEIGVANCAPEVAEVLALGAQAQHESHGAFSVWRPGPDG